MRSKLVSYVIGLPTTLATSWSTICRRPWRSLFALLGFALRFAIAFLVCFWLYSSLDIVRYCMWSGGLTNFIVDLVYCPLLAWTFTTGEYFDITYHNGVALPQILLIVLCTLVISVAWGAICRRRCAGAEPKIPRSTI